MVSSGGPVGPASSVSPSTSSTSHTRSNQGQGGVSHGGMSATSENPKSSTSEAFFKKGGVSHAPMSGTSPRPLGHISAGGVRSGARPKLKFKAHSLLWRYALAGPHRPQRGKFKRVQMRNWERRIWQFEGSTIVCNLKTAELWLTSRAYSSPQKMLAANRMRADLIRRRFSKWQEVALELIEAPHPEGAERAHLVIDEKKHGPHFKHLKNQLGRADAAQIGLKTDDSHPGHVELDGPQAIEGAVGMDWNALIFPNEWRGFKDYIHSSLEEFKKIDKHGENGWCIDMVGSGEIGRQEVAYPRQTAQTIAEVRERGGPGPSLRGGLSTSFTVVMFGEHDLAERCMGARTLARLWLDGVE